MTFEPVAMTEQPPIERQRMDVDIVCVGFGPATAGFLTTLSRQMVNLDGTPAVESRAVSAPNRKPRSSGTQGVKRATGRAGPIAKPAIKMISKESLLRLIATGAIVRTGSLRLDSSL